MNRRSTVKREAASPARTNVTSAKKRTPEKNSTRRIRNTSGTENEKENARSPCGDVLENRLKRVTIIEPEPEQDEPGMEQFGDETAAVAKSAVELFFMQGKSYGDLMNKTRRTRRGKSKNTIADENMEQQDDDVNARKPVSSAFFQCDLTCIRDFITKRNESKLTQRRIEAFEKEFPKWKLYLAADFNLLLHGVGSKRELLDRFEKSQLKNVMQMRVDATHENATFRAVLGAINQHLKLQCPGRGLSNSEWAQEVAKQIAKSSRQLTLLIDNLDAPRWRNEQGAVCCLLANRRHVKLVATIDHINAPLMWNSRQLATFCFLHIRCDTLILPLHELVTGNSRALGLDAKSSHVTHSMASLEVFWKSLALNSQKIFQLFFNLYFSKNEPINFWELFNEAKDEFCVSTDCALRAQLGEFKDHRIIKWSRSDDGNDQLSGIVDRDLIKQFLQSKGMPLSFD